MGLAGGVVADVVVDDFLFQAFEVVVAAVAEEFGSVLCVADLEGVAA